jgi:hypothetical protein
MARRIRLYLLGVVLGLVIVFLFFGDRLTAWMPGNHVLRLIAESEISVSEKMACQMNCRKITGKDIISMLKNGKVHFDESKTSGNPKVYEVRHEKLTARFKVHTKDSVATLIKLSGKEENCACTEVSKDSLLLLSLSNRTVINRLKKADLQVTKKVNCLLMCNQIPLNDLKKILRIGTLSANTSFPEPNYIISGEVNKILYGFKFIFEAEDKVKFIDVTSKKEEAVQTCECDS